MHKAPMLVWEGQGACPELVSYLNFVCASSLNLCTHAYVHVCVVTVGVKQSSLC